MAVRNRYFRIAALLLAASYLLLAGKELLEAIHLFQEDPVIVEYKIAVSVRVAAHLVGAFGWATIATAFAGRVDRSRLLLGSIVLGSAFVGFVVAAVLEAIPVLADSPDADVRGVYRWGAIASILLVVAAAVVVAGLLESRRGPDLAPRLQIGLVFASLSAGAQTVSLFYQQSHDSSRGFVHSLPAGRLVVALAALAIALAAFVLTLGVRSPLPRREATLALAASGVAMASLAYAVGVGIVALAYAAYGAPTWLDVTGWLNVTDSLVLIVAYSYIASGARSAARSAVPD